MSFEILYTSAPEGLRKGSQGYCTVVSTRGIPKTLAERLEMRGGYPHPFSPGDPNNPVNYSHLLLPVGGITYHLLSRIADFGYDYSRRSNKLAHHVALAPEELTQGGPAWVLAGEGFCETTWDGKTRLRERGRPARTDPCKGGICKAWGRLCGDPGWAGVLAENAMSKVKKTAYVIFKPGGDMLPLVVEAMALLPPKERWQTTFSTYYTKLQSVESIRWCFVLDGSQEANSARRDPRVTLIDLCSNPGRAPDSPYVEYARTGEMPLPKAGELLRDEPPAPPLTPSGSKRAADKRQESQYNEDASGIYGFAMPNVEQSSTLKEASFVYEPLSVDGSSKLPRLPRQRKNRPWVTWAIMSALVLVIIGLLVNQFVFDPSHTNGTVPRTAASEVAKGDRTKAKEAKVPAPIPISAGEATPTEDKAVPDVNASDNNPTDTLPSKASPDKTNASETAGNDTTSQSQAANSTSEPNPTSDSPKSTKNTPSLKEQLPDYLELPDMIPNSLKPFSCPLVLDSSKELKLELLGPDSFILEQSEDKEIFTVLYNGKQGSGQLGNKPEKLGDFKLKSGKLLFHPVYTDSLEGTYEVFRCCALRFSYEGEVPQIRRLRNDARGHLGLDGEFFKDEYTSWTLQTDSKKKKPFKIQWNNQIGPQLKIDICLNDCSDSSVKERMTFLWSNSQWNRENKFPNAGEILFDTELVEELGSLQLRLIASYEVKYLKFDGVTDIPSTFKDKLAIFDDDELNLRKKRVDKELISFRLNEESLAKVKKYRKEIEEQIDLIENIDTRGDSQKNNLLESNKKVAKEVESSVKKWIDKAKDFQKDFPLHLRSGTSEIEATLYAVVRNETTNVRVPIITFTTKKK